MMNATKATMFMGIIAQLLTTAMLGGRSEGELYAILSAQDVDLRTFNALVACGEKSGLWTRKSHWMTATEKGRLLADRLDNILAASKALDEAGC